MGKRPNMVLFLPELVEWLGRKTLDKTTSRYAFTQACGCKCTEGKPREGTLSRNSQSEVLIFCSTRAGLAEEVTGQQVSESFYRAH